jgi:hypothetical protein
VSACRLCGGDAEAVVAAAWEFCVPIQPPSQNDIAMNHGNSRFRYSRIRTDFETYVRAQVMLLKIPRATARRRVTFTRLYTGRGQRRDRGNLIGGMKPVLDALVRQGLLVDDREEYCEDYYRQERHASISGVVMRIEELA